MKKIHLVSILLALSTVGCSTERTEEPSPTMSESVITQTTNSEIESNISKPSVDILTDLNVESPKMFTDGEEIFISSSGTYYFTGAYSTSSIVVDVDKSVDKGTVFLILDNATFTSDTLAPMVIWEAQQAVVYLPEGTSSTLIQGDIVTTDTDFPSAALYAKSDLLITGGGTLSVDTLYCDGINGRDDVEISQVTLNINSFDDGIVAKDFLGGYDSHITIQSKGDGMKSTNDEDLDRGNFHISGGNFHIQSEKDCLSAENTMEIDSGTFYLSSGGGFVEVLNEITKGEGKGNYIQPTDLLETSMRGIKALHFLVSGGTFVLDSYEDAIHINDTATFLGGDFTITCGDDGIHADNILLIEEITLNILESYEALEADFLIINGGTMCLRVLDDAINAGSEDGYIRITGGDIEIYCSGDGIDSNGDFFFHGGDIMIDAQVLYAGGDGAVDVSGSTTVTGGTIVDLSGNIIDPTGSKGSSKNQKQR